LREFASIYNKVELEKMQCEFSFSTFQILFQNMKLILNDTHSQIFNGNVLDHTINDQKYTKVAVLFGTTKLFLFDKETQKKWLFQNDSTIEVNLKRDLEIVGISTIGIEIVTLPFVDCINLHFQFLFLLEHFLKKIDLELFKFFGTSDRETSVEFYFSSVKNTLSLFSLPNDSYNPVMNENERSFASDPTVVVFVKFSNSQIENEFPLNSQIDYSEQNEESQDIEIESVINSTEEHANRTKRKSTEIEESGESEESEESENNIRTKRTRTSHSTEEHTNRTKRKSTEIEESGESEESEESENNIRTKRTRTSQVNINRRSNDNELNNTTANENLNNIRKRKRVDESDDD
jgi:hypothetical protein